MIQKSGASDTNGTDISYSLQNQENGEKEKLKEHSGCSDSSFWPAGLPLPTLQFGYNGTGSFKAKYVEDTSGNYYI